MTKNAVINTPLFADDLFIIQDSKHKLHSATDKLSVLSVDYKTTISLNKNKVMAFVRVEPVQSKITINRKR